MLTIEQKRLVEDYLPLLSKLAMMYSKKSGYEFDECYQNGAFGLISATKKYDGSKAKFATYANKKIMGAILDGVRVYNRVREKRANGIGLESTLEYVDEWIPSYSIEESVYNKYTIETAIKNMKKQGKNKQLFSLIKRHYEGYKNKDIADMLGVNESTSSLWCREAEKIARKHMG